MVIMIVDVLMVVFGECRAIVVAMVYSMADLHGGGMAAVVAMVAMVAVTMRDLWGDVAF